MIFKLGDTPTIITKESLEEAYKEFSKIIDKRIRGEYQHPIVYLEPTFANCLRPYSKRVKSGKYEAFENGEGLYTVGKSANDEKSTTYKTNSSVWIDMTLEFDSIFNPLNSLGIFFGDKSSRYELSSKNNTTFFDLTSNLTKTAMIIRKRSGSSLDEETMRDLVFSNSNMNFITSLNLNHKLRKELSIKKHNSPDMVRPKVKFFDEEVTNSIVTLPIEIDGASIGKATFFTCNNKLYRINEIDENVTDTFIPDWKVYDLSKGEIIDNFDIPANEDGILILKMLTI